MRRSLLKKSAVLALLILLLMAYSSFERPDPLDDIPEAATEYPAISALAHRNDVSDYTTIERSEENQAEALSNIVFGLGDAYIELSAPDFLPQGSTLVCEAVVRNANPGTECLLTWYLDETVMLAEWIVTGADLPGMYCFFEYSRTLPESVVVKVSLLYVTMQGDVNEITAEKTVTLGNHSKAYWMELEAARVLDEVSDMYKGDYTLQWALENDYDDFDKEVFVNIKGYKSDTDYLLWVNRSHQRVNVFIGSAGNWELIETFIVASGRPGAGTKRGVTTIPSRSEAGWLFGTYTVKPVVRFWPGTGYAFHSRILHPRTGVVIDESIGFPVSAGCIRMYCEDLKYIYDNIPDGTTVVVH